MRNSIRHGYPEKGYFLLEAIFLGIIVLAMASGMLLYVQSREANIEDGCRMQAAYLAHYQIAAVEQELSGKATEGGSIPWLGRDEDLQTGDVSYRVRSELIPREGDKVLQVTVSWNKTGRKGEVKLEKVIVRHG